MGPDDCRIVRGVEGCRTGGMAVDSAIAGRPDFERLEMKAQSGKIGELLAKLREHLSPKAELMAEAG